MATKKQKKWTEKRWLTETDPQAMIEFLGDAASDRKLRLFACACCRRAWKFAKNKRLKELLPLLEKIADGQVKDRERARAHNLSDETAHARLDDMQQCLGWEFWGATAKPLDRGDPDFGELAAAAFGYAAGLGSKFGKAKKAERERQTPVVREFFGNPFKPVGFSLTWRTDTVLTLAKQMYDSREFSAMPILADALQDAGCDSEDLLNHLRDTSLTHYRGCWALDHVLGME